VPASAAFDVGTPAPRAASVMTIAATRWIDLGNSSSLGGWAVSTRETPGFAPPPHGGFAFVRSCAGFAQTVAYIFGIRRRYF
jgi:hypothetical protein